MWVRPWRSFEGSVLFYYNLGLIHISFKQPNPHRALFRWNSGCSTIRHSIELVATTSGMWLGPRMRWDVGEWGRKEGGSRPPMNEWGRWNLERGTEWGVGMGQRLELPTVSASFFL